MTRSLVKHSIMVSALLCTTLMSSPAEAVRENSVWGTVPSTPAKEKSVFDFFSGEKKSVWGREKAKPSQQKVEKIAPQKQVSSGSVWGFSRNKKEAVKPDLPQAVVTKEVLVQAEVLKDETPVALNIKNIPVARELAEVQPAAGASAVQSSVWGVPKKPIAQVRNAKWQAAPKKAPNNIFQKISNKIAKKLPKQPSTYAKTDPSVMSHAAKDVTTTFGGSPWRKPIQEPLTPSVRQELAQAYQAGGKNLLTTVEELVVKYPQMSDAIVSHAQTIAVGNSVATGSAIAAAGNMGSFSLASLTLGSVTAGQAAAIATVGIASGASVEKNGESNVARPFVSNGDAGFSVDAEYAASTGLAQINADDGYERSTGAGVKVAVLDTGIDDDHEEFTGQIDPAGFDYVDDDTTLEDADGHGTHVSGIIAAARDGFGMHGVAYNASIMPMRVFSTLSLDEPDSDFGDAVDRAAANGAKIINNSWGVASSITDGGVNRATLESVYFPFFLPAMSDAIQDDKVIFVMAAGNDSLSEVSASAGIPVYYPELEDHFLAVVSVDSSNNISSFSNQCGVAQDFCLAAPGESILSTVPYDLGTEDRVTDGLALAQGTSMAAPHVSGALALLMDNFLGLDADDAVQILLTTATDLGATGVDSVFGHGLLNLDVAMTAFGGTKIPTGKTVTGSSSGTGSSSVKGLSVFGDGLSKAASSQKIIILDQYNRAFSTTVGEFTQAVYDRFDADQAFSRFTRSKPHTEKLGVNSEYAFTSYTPSQDFADPSDDPMPEVRDLRFTTGGKDASFTAYMNAPVWASFGVYGQASVQDTDMAIEDALAGGHLSLMSEDDSMGSVAQIKLGEGQFKFGSFFGAMDGADEDNKAFTTVAEYSQDLSHKTKASWQVGSLVEQNSLLGTSGDGAFEMGRGTTFFTGMSMDHEVAEKTRLLTNYQIGMSYMSGAEQSLFGDFSNVGSDSFSVGLVRDDALSNSDKLGFSVSQPLRVFAGQGDLVAPTFRDAEGNIIQQTSSLELAPSGREIDLQGWYYKSFGNGDKNSVKISGAIRHEPGHVEDADADFIGMLRVKREL